MNSLPTFDHHHLSESSFVYWLKGYTPAEMQLLNDFVDGKINSRPTAISFTKNVDISEDFDSPLYHNYGSNLLGCILTWFSHIERVCRLLEQYVISQSNRWIWVINSSLWGPFVRLIKSLGLGGSVSVYLGLFDLHSDANAKTTHFI